MRCPPSGEHALSPNSWVWMRLFVGLFAKVHRIVFRHISPITFVAGVALLATPSPGQASFWTGAGSIEGKAVSASALFQIDANGGLRITLTNTAASAHGAATILTNLEFNLSGVTLGIGGDAAVLVNAGSSVVGGPALTDVSGGWVFGQD